jgi:hypothetical protein
LDGRLQLARRLNVIPCGIRKEAYVISCNGDL